MAKYIIGLGGQLANKKITALGQRSVFLYKMFEVIPHSFQEILDLYFEFEEMCNKLGKEKNKPLYFLGTFEETAQVESIKQKLIQWSSKNNINEEWLNANLFQTFMVWYEDESTKYNPYIIDPVVGESRTIVEKWHSEGKVKSPVYNRLLLTEEEFDQKVEEYKNQVDQLLKEHGYVFANEKRILDSYEWFVYFHVLQQSIEEIAEKCFVSDDSVKKGIREIYNTIGLERHNRKRKKKL